VSKAKAWWDQLLAQGGIEVVQAQEIELRKGDDANTAQYFFTKNGELEQVAASSLTLITSVRDAAGNETVTTFTAALQCTDGDASSSALEEPTGNGLPNQYLELPSPPLSVGGVVRMTAFPNPFHSELTIRFDLPQSAETSLRIFNLQGQLVNQLQDGPLEAGDHQSSWDGTDMRGAPLPSGLYLLQLRIGDEVLNRKVMLQQP
jgi:hypothetical protein